MAPIRPARISGALTMAGSTTPLPMVLATWAPKTRKAMKLKNAAQATAVCGESTRVLTTVAIELAASWNPLMKSNASANPMMSQISAVMGMGSAVLQDDGLDDVGDVFAHV